MGGTGIALARDGMAPFANPATIVRVDAPALAFSVNFYDFRSTHLTAYHQPGPASLGSTRFDAVPSTLCVFFNVRDPRHKMAACLGNVERQGFEATADAYSASSAGARASLAQSLSRRWNRLYVGPSYALSLTKRVAIGVSLHGIATTTSSTLSVGSIVSDASGHSTAAAYDQATTAYSVDVGAVLGVTWRVDDVHTIGLSLAPRALHASGRYRGTFGIDQSNASSSYALLQTASGSFVAPPPMRAGIGFGSETARVRIEGDASVWIPAARVARADVHVNRTETFGGKAATSSQDGSLDASAGPVVDAALGIEWFPRPTLSFLAGVSTDFSALAPIASPPPLGTVADSRVHRAAASFGIGSYGGTGTELLFGTELSYFWGQSVTVDPYASAPRPALVGQHGIGAILMVAGTVSFSSVKRTLENISRRP